MGQISRKIGLRGDLSRFIPDKVFDYLLQEKNNQTFLLINLFVDQMIGIIENFTLEVLKAEYQLKVSPSLTCLLIRVLSNKSERLKLRVEVIAGNENRTHILCLEGR